MNTTKNKFNKIIAKTISNVMTNIANTSTEACVTLCGIEEPKMPTILLKKHLNNK